MTNAKQTTHTGAWPFIRRRLRLLIYLVGIVLSLVGSYQVVRPQTVGAWEFVTNMVNSVIKLFMFAPIVPISEVAPPAFELATWIAPLGTVLGFFQVFTRIWLGLRQWLRHERRRHLVVLGDPVSAVPFLLTLAGDDPAERLLYLLPSGTVLEAAEDLEKRGIRVLSFDFDHPGCYENEMLRRRYRLHESFAIVCFGGGPQGLGRLGALDLLLAATISEPIPTHVESRSLGARELIAWQTAGWKSFDVQFFDLNELRALELLQSEHFPLHCTPGLERDWSADTLSSEAALAEAIGRPHLLIVGFGELGQALLRQAVNLGTVNPRQPLAVSIVDREAGQNFDFFTADIAVFERVCEVELLNYDVRAAGLPAELERIAAARPFTAAAFCLPDSEIAVLGCERLRPLLQDRPIAIASRRPDDIKILAAALEKRGARLTLFGSDSKILNRSVILNDSMIEQAQAFNARYNRTAALLSGAVPDARSPRQQWQALGMLAKESSVAQTLHRQVKRAILERIVSVGGGPSTVEELGQSWSRALDGLDIAAQVSLIERDPVMNFLTELEHRRWNNFHYLRGFRFAETKDWIAKTHDCLIDDWDDFLSGPQREKAIYDFISVLAASESEETASGLG
ncbi:MAG: hypothetical protein QM296_02990 [Bacillota bacterium]|nr:hypothetical protein [Bacillota bacterium]